MTIDSACSSSLVTIHQACQSLRQQECQMALAGGVNLMLLPDSMIVASKAKMLSPDGYCKTFDAAANGTTWGEGCGVLVLKRLSDALESGDRILALIRGSVVNQDGPSSGFTVPNGNSQKQLIHQALKAAKIEPSQVSYIETHGTGTALGDPIELNSLAEVFGAERTKKKPLMIGSVKTNIGHLSSAAGIAGVIKAILQLQHQQIAPHLHFKNPTPKFNWKDFPLVVPTELTSWQVKDGTRIAGINSFGASGTNAHLILEEAPVQDEMHPPILNQGGLEQQLRIKSERPKHLLTLSAKTEKALAELVSCYQNHLQIHSELKLEDICYTANSGRFHFHHRLAILASNLEELVSKLAHHQKAAKVAGLYTNKVSDNNSQPKKAFLFTGQGSQYLNMGKELYQTQPLFRHTVDQCSQLLQPYLEHSLLSVIYPDTQTTQNSDLINQTAYTQPALFAIEYALCQLWQSWGIKPDILMGHSVGEYVAACIAGIFSLEDGLKLIAHRGRLMQQLPSGGQMVVVRAAEAEIKSIIAPDSEQVAIAAINGPENVVISGATPEIAEIVSLLTAKGIKTTTLKVSHGFHSPVMQEMLNSFETQARQISYHAPEIPIISNVTGERAAPSIATAEYWVNHVMKPVRFADSIKTLETEDYGIFIEIGPKPILLGMGSQCVGENKYLWLASLREEVGAWEQMLCSLGKLYVQGVDIDWTGFHRKSLCNKVLLPTYPFQRQRYWVETNSCLPKKAVLHPLLRERLHIVGLENQILFQTQLSASEPSYLNDHQVFGQPVLPAAAYLEMALAAGVAIFQDSNLILEEVNIYQALILSEKKAKTLQLILKPDQKNGYTFEIFSLNIAEEQQAPVWTLHISGKLLRGEIPEEKRGFDLSLIEQEYGKQMSISSFYESLTEFGMYYGSNFQGVQKLYVSQEKALSFSQLPPHLSLQSQSYQIHPILLDSCLHSGYAL
ncbi:MAG: acyltransferase domain-containing protein, partial [Okeania sp. SIO2B9]|nr:acyltransferase domain-containing protein [Okeania sp. SIO2B9]